MPSGWGEPTDGECRQPGSREAYTRMFQMFQPSDSVIPSLDICPREIIRDLVKHFYTKVFIHNLFIQLKF